MHHRAPDPASLRSLGERRVRIRLKDQTEFVGSLRTDLLSENSISVYLERAHSVAEGGDGVTIYLDSIVEIAPIS